MDATLTRAQGSFSNGKPAEIELVVETTQPKVVEAQLEQARTTALKIVGRPLVIFRGEIIHTLYQEELTSMLTFRQEGDRSVADLDPNELAIVVQEMAGKVNREPKDATFRFAGGVLSVATESEDGLKVDVSASVEAIRKAAITENRNVELVVKITPPAVASKDMDKMGIKERLITAGTVYGDTGLDRQYNVRLAVERLDGTLIPPGSTYSFNEALGPTGIEDGYRYGWGIISTATGGHETVKSEAGGICQVATTMFHAAFNLGLRIDERTEHIYWIPRYGRPPLGKTGLDATVDGSGSATTLDLKFTNTTKHWLAIEGSYDGMNMYFSIWGTDPGWTVEVGEPEISNIVYTSTQVVRIIDKGLEVGEEVWTESAQDGFDVTVRRIVSSGGKVLDDMTVVSHYRPAQNVIRYNPATTPTPQATVPGAGTPSATEPGATAPAEGTPPAEPVPTATPGGEPDPRATEPKPAG